MVYKVMKKRIFCIIIFAAIMSVCGLAQEKRSIMPELQTSESIFFDPTANSKADAYKFSTPWRLEVGYAQLNHRTQDTSALYLHGVRLGATVDFVLPYHFSIQTGALATLTFGKNAHKWPSTFAIPDENGNYMTGDNDYENTQNNFLQNDIVQLQLTIPVRAYYNITLWRKLRMFFFAGPQLQIGLTNYYRVQKNLSPTANQWLAKQGVKTTDYDQYLEKQLYRTNIQFGLGGGFEWDRYRLQAGYDFGLNNILRSNKSLHHKMNEWGWMCTFSYQL